MSFGQAIPLSRQIYAVVQSYLEEQLDFLIAQRCDHYQDYYFHKSITSSEIERMQINTETHSNKVHAIAFSMVISS